MRSPPGPRLSRRKSRSVVSCLCFSQKHCEGFFRAELLVNLRRVACTDWQHLRRNLHKATCAEQLAQSNLRRATCKQRTGAVEQLAQSNLHQNACAEQLAPSNLRRAACAEQLAQCNLHTHGFQCFRANRPLVVWGGFGCRDEVFFLSS